MVYHFREFAIPDRMMQSLHDYCAFGHPVGHFLTAVLSNDLAEACARADEDNLRNLPAYVHYLYNEAPSTCWGSPEKVKAWLAKMAEQRELARGPRP